MKFYDLAYKNVKGNLYRYIMYFFSNVFSVMLFFIFANFIFHPTVMGLKASQNSMLYSISKGLTACEYVIIVFSFFFVSYSNSTFIKSRSREFGLLSMFGMTKGQIRKYVGYENIIISLFSILGGIVVGGIFSKLFFMMVEAILKSGTILNFVIAPKAVIITAVTFFLLFQVINLFSLRNINNKTIVLQLKSQKIPKPVPKFSKALAALGIILVVAGYAMAWFSGVGIVVTMIPILIVTIAGTYFIFTQFSVAAARKLQSNKHVFYKKTNMVILSQIIYKLRDNAKVFFLIAILGAVTLTAAGTLYALFNETKVSFKDMVPEHVSFMEKGIESHDAANIDKFQSVFVGRGVKVLSNYKIMAIKGTWNKEKGTKYEKGNLLAISCSDYNKRAKALNIKKLDLNGDDIEIAELNGWTKNPMNFKINYDINGKIFKDRIKGSIRQRVLSLNRFDYDYAVVLSDVCFKNMIKNAPQSSITTYYGWDLNNWKSDEAYKAVKEINNLIPQKYQKCFCEVVTIYQNSIRGIYITMLVGLFVAVLFLIAAGSLIYFKLFSELQQDKSEFTALMKMGMMKKEMSRIINVQMSTIFFLPFIVACLHASFALKALSDILRKNLVSVGLTVILIYFAFEVIYYLIMKLIYKSQIKTI